MTILLYSFFCIAANSHSTYPVYYQTMYPSPSFYSTPVYYVIQPVVPSNNSRNSNIVTYLPYQKTTNDAWAITQRENIGNTMQQSYNCLNPAQYSHQYYTSMAYFDGEINAQFKVNTVPQNNSTFEESTSYNPIPIKKAQKNIFVQKGVETQNITAKGLRERLKYKYYNHVQLQSDSKFFIDGSLNFVLDEYKNLWLRKEIENTGPHYNTTQLYFYYFLPDFRRSENFINFKTTYKDFNIMETIYHYLNDNGENEKDMQKFKTISRIIYDGFDDDIERYAFAVFMKWSAAKFQNMNLEKSSKDRIFNFLYERSGTLRNVSLLESLSLTINSWKSDLIFNAQDTHSSHMFLAGLVMNHKFNIALIPDEACNFFISLNKHITYAYKFLRTQNSKSFTELKIFM